MIMMRQASLSATVFASIFLLCASSFSPVQRVVVVGGTHGNEYTGVWCIKALKLKEAALKAQYPSLNITTLLANPEAHLANKRFIHTDLNREFSVDKLCEINDDYETPPFRDTVEGMRARELDQLIGSKCESDDPDEYDVAIDLHSTTSNMGTTLILAEGDALMAQGAAYVAQKCPNTRCLMHSITEKEWRPNLSSAAKHGFTIEVGPVPQGLLRHEAVLKTECAMHALLEFLQRRNAGEDVLGELNEAYPSGLVPTFRTKPAKRPGEMSYKITWPSDPENPNFPTLMVHESLQDRDFHVVRKGDPLFVGLDGTVSYYDGSHGDEVHVIFVNEAGYYYASSGTGITVSIQTQFDLNDGLLAQQAECEVNGSADKLPVE